MARNSALHDKEGVVRHETIAYQIAGINNQITDEFGSVNDMTVTGGGKGWTAKTTMRDGRVETSKGSSKLAAAENLYRHIANNAVPVEEQIAPDGGRLGEDLDFEDMTEGEAAQCVAECVTSIKPYCECRCGGINHGAGVGGGMVARLGDKLCKCGCGESTKRQFVPGHDARYHAREALVKWGLENHILMPAKGYTEADIEGVKEVKVKQQRKAARERRAAKRAKQAKIEAKAARAAAKAAKV